MGGHSHSHTHADAGTNRTRLIVALALTSTVVVAQAVGALVTGSLALLTDTAHALVDASGLLVAVIAATMMRRPPSPKRTWGFARVEVIAALAQASLLLVVGTIAVVEGIQRLFHPQEIPGMELLVFGLIGLVSNVAAIFVLHGGRGDNLNMRAAFLEVVNDALGSLAVVVSAVVIMTTGFTRADSIAALFIAVLILPRAVLLMRDTMRILLEFTPPGVDMEEVRAHLLALDHVKDVHDLHASIIGTGLPVLSVHVVVDDECFRTGHAPEILAEIHTCLREHFPVAFDHATVQLETSALSHEAGHIHHA